MESSRKIVKRQPRRDAYSVTSSAKRGKDVATVQVVASKTSTASFICRGRRVFYTRTEQVGVGPSYPTTAPQSKKRITKESTTRRRAKKTIVRKKPVRKTIVRKRPVRKTIVRKKPVKKSITSSHKIKTKKRN